MRAQAQDDDSITYADGIITVDGTYNDVFEDIYLADQAGGWGFFTKIGNDAYACNNTQIDFGDNVNETVASDKSCSINFFGGSGTAFRVRNNATVTFGTLLNSGRKSTAEGISFIVDSMTYIELVDGSTTNFYGCSLVSDQNLYMDFVGAGNIYNSIFSNGYWMFCVYDTATYNFFNVYISNDLECPIYLADCSLVTFDIIYSHDSPILFYLDASEDLTLRNIVGEGATIYSFYVEMATANIYLINPSVDFWTFNIGGSLGDKLFRQYSFDLTVTYPNGTGIQNANVTVKHYGQAESQDFTELTDSNGQISQKTLSMGFYNQTGGNTIYNYNPYHIEITNVPGYETYNGNFTLDEKTNWEICLCPESYNWFGVTIIIGILACFMFVLVLTAKK